MSRDCPNASAGGGGSRACHKASSSKKNLSDPYLILIIYFSVEKKVTCHESARILDLVEVEAVEHVTRQVPLIFFRVIIILN